MINLGTEAEWIVLSFELERIEYPKYRVTLVGPDGSAVWQGEGFIPNHQDALVLSLSSTVLPDGDNETSVEGRPSHGSPVVGIGRCIFRVVRRPAGGSPR